MAGFRNIQSFSIVILSLELLVVSVLIFTSGFLLTRQVIDTVSSCKDSKEFELLHPTESADLPCWIKPTFKRVVVLIVDALRYDFATYNNSIPVSQALPYQNKMPIFNELLQDNPRQSRLYPFIADAPTTTMQRLKGLTTGSLPTFIDASRNFASEEILEDNLIDQIAKHGKHMIMLGDDTWGSLFPGRFLRQHLYPSFNVMDLNTVDNGVLAHLQNEMSGADWDVIIAHFLGVDHCGHRYGPNHPEMANKLEQINDEIKKVSSQIDNDTVLLVFGDHGMTRTGDHGGDSVDEVTSALFVYSPAFDLKPQGSPTPVMQVDLVPTVSLLLGVPIPYSSLGNCIEELFGTKYRSEDDVLRYQLKALNLNMKQVERYLKTYTKQGNDFSQDYWARIEHIKVALEKSGITSRERKSLYNEYIDIAKMMCEERWAKFSVGEMFIGILLLLITVILIILLTTVKLENDDDEKDLSKKFIIFMVVCNVLLVLFSFVSIFAMGCVTLVLELVMIIWCQKYFKYFAKTMNPENVIAVTLVCLLFLGNFSNSFTVVEDQIVCASLLSLALVRFIFILYTKQKKNFKINKLSFGTSEITCMFAFILIMVCVKASTSYWKCREEQSWCEPSDVHTPMPGLAQDKRNWRYLTSLLMLGIFAWAPRRWLTKCGNMNGTRVSILSYEYGFPVVCLLILAYWALQAVPPMRLTFIPHYLIIIPLVIYCLTFILASILMLLPLMIYEVPRADKDRLVASDNPFAVIPHIAQSVSQKFHSGPPKDKDKENAPIPIVYGLATAVSAPLIVVMMSVLIVVILICGDGLVPSLVVLGATAIGCLALHVVVTWMSQKDQDVECGILQTNLSSICIWFILSLHGFYSMGHQATFPTLHWAAAFVGFDGNWGTNVIPAVLVGLNTFSSQLLFGLALPLLVLTPLAAGVIYPKLCGRKSDDLEGSRGEFLLVELIHQGKGALRSTLLIYVALHATKVLCSATAALVLRRHLMVWKIFAPHFLFEAVGLLVTCASVLFSYCYVHRILASLLSWSKTLERKES